MLGSFEQPLATELSPRRAYVLVCITAVLVLTGAFSRHASLRNPDLRIARSELQPWMLQALPGIGPKKRDPALRAVQEHRDHTLPRSARAVLPLVLNDE